MSNSYSSMLEYTDLLNSKLKIFINTDHKLDETGYETHEEYFTLASFKRDKKSFININKYKEYIDKLYQKIRAELIIIHYNLPPNPDSSVSFFEKQLNKLNSLISNYDITNGVPAIKDEKIEIKALDYFDKNEGANYSTIEKTELIKPDYKNVRASINEIINFEHTHLTNFRQGLLNYTSENKILVTHNKITDELINISRDVYKNFKKYFDYNKEEEFVKAITKLEKLKCKKKYTSALAYLFTEVFSKKIIKGRAEILHSLFKVRNKSKDSLGNIVQTDPIMNKIEDYLTSI